MDERLTWSSVKKLLVSMKIGVICEGHTDRAVIATILNGIANIQHADIVPIRPEDDYDETDLPHLNPNSFGGWTNVHGECISREKIREFLSLEGNDWIVIQIDTAEAHLYEVIKPNEKNKNYCKQLRELVIAKINVWLENEFTNNILYAIAVQEIDAWILTLYIDQVTHLFLNAKHRLKRALSRKGINSSETFQNYYSLSYDFTKKRTFVREDVYSKNESLQFFCEEVRAKLA